MRTGHAAGVHEVCGKVLLRSIDRDLEVILLVKQYSERNQLKYGIASLKIDTNLVFEEGISEAVTRDGAA